MIFRLGDFSQMADLHSMYDHCKATEDKDLTIMDFVTDHLINIDGLFDQHKHGDDQKPHKPKQNNSVMQVFQILEKHIPFETQPYYEYVVLVKHMGDCTSHYQFQTASDIFHPPATV
jgi:hypothetical protein